jgi:hypothetical protein
MHATCVGPLTRQKSGRTGSSSRNSSGPHECRRYLPAARRAGDGLAYGWNPLARKLCTERAVVGPVEIPKPRPPPVQLMSSM